MEAAIRATALIVTLALLSFSVARTVRAQDAVKVDRKHYKVDFENDQVRVLRVHIGPHQKKAMHDRRASVAVFLTDNHVKFTFPDGKDGGAQRREGWAGTLGNSAQVFGRKPE